MNQILSALMVAWLFPTFAAAADGPKLIDEYSWQSLAKADQLLAGSIVLDDVVGPVLKVVKQGDQQMTTVLEIENPPITSQFYRIEGRVRYEGVSQQSFLETWNHFPDGNAYFSRTLGMSGPMQSLSGNSAWRDFSLPFSFEGGSMAQPPSRVQFNVVLPKDGTVWLSDVSLRQFPSLASATTLQEAWWGSQTSGYIGAVMGMSLGLLGALIGTLAGIGRARRFTISIQIMGVIAGIVSLVAGVVALIVGQPYSVYFPLLLCGFIGTVVMGSLLPVLFKRYAEHELRRMQSVDA